MTITPEWIEANREMHKKHDKFGSTSIAYFHEIVRLINSNGKIKSVLDYGCGKGELVKALQLQFPGIEIQGYDPAVEEYSAPPKIADMVICTDVLEHVEPQHLPSVLQRLRGLQRMVGFYSISLVPAKDAMPDGTQAHISLWPAWHWYRIISDNRIFILHSSESIKHFVLITLGFEFDPPQGKLT